MASYVRDELLGAQRNGANLTQMNLGQFRTPGTLGFGPLEDKYPTFSDDLLNWFKEKKVTSVRVPFTWEAVQPEKKGPIVSGSAKIGQGYQTYWLRLRTVVAKLLARRISVILCPWQYNPRTNTTDILYDGQPFSEEEFADFWREFARAINGVTGDTDDAALIAFDLINEPHVRRNPDLPENEGDTGIKSTDWFKFAAAAITEIRRVATNPIFVSGMDYGHPKTFVQNSAEAWLKMIRGQADIAVTAHCYEGLTRLIGEPPSKKPVTVLRDACKDMVAWARQNRIKVNIGEIALDAGDNGQPLFCGPDLSDFATARAQWDDWIKFCTENNDVMVGWNWWATSEAGQWNAGDSCDPDGYHWGLTFTNGQKDREGKNDQTVYMNLIESSLPTRFLYLRDNPEDVGSEPNLTTPYNVWESPAISVRIDKVGHLTTAVTVTVWITNSGPGPYAGDGNDIVRLFWAKGEAGLAWPDPWLGGTPRGGPIGEQVVPSIDGVGPANAVPLRFVWSAPTQSHVHPGASQFALLAIITKNTAPVTDPFERFLGSNLGENVRRLNNVAIRNVFLSPIKHAKIGTLVISNRTADPMAAQVMFEILDPTATPIDPTGATLLMKPGSGAQEWMAQYQGGPPFLEYLGHGTFRLLDVAAGLPHLVLQPGEALEWELRYPADPATRGYAVRAAQFAWQGAARTMVGGQTFVAGEVEGFTIAGNTCARGSWRDSACTWVCRVVALVYKGQARRRPWHEPPA